MLTCRLVSNERRGGSWWRHARTDDQREWDALGLVPRVGILAGTSRSALFSFLYLLSGKFWQLETMDSSSVHAMNANQSPLRGALLALIVQRSSHGYALASRLQRQLGQSWPIHRTSLYRMLRGMHEDALIVAESADESNPARIVYSPTDLAAPAVVAWMDSPLPLGEGQLQLQARMVVARQEDLPRLLVALNGYERELFAKRAKIEADVPTKRQLRSAMMFLVREAPIQRINGELLWVDLSRQTIRDLMVPRPS
jgi:DNA-binding PadR family transcriptional regulator